MDSFHYNWHNRTTMIGRLRREIEGVMPKLLQGVEPPAELMELANKFLERLSFHARVRYYPAFDTGGQSAAEQDWVAAETARITEALTRTDDPKKGIAEGNSQE